MCGPGDLLLEPAVPTVRREDFSVSWRGVSILSSFRKST